MSRAITALMLCLTLHVTNATAERSLSKLRFITNFLRSTKSESPECIGLALLSIEAESARKKIVDSLAGWFASAKTRREAFPIM